MLMPQRLVKQNQFDAFEIMLRVSKRMEKGKIIVSNDKEILLSLIQNYLTPGESIHLTVKYPEMDLPIRVEVVEL
jgi:hypothetical protein